jgi:hypothetical protein
VTGPAGFSPTRSSQWPTSTTLYNPGAANSQWATTYQDLHYRVVTKEQSQGSRRCETEPVPFRGERVPLR